jgi:predicted alpha/beta-fold hydrolase
MRRDRPSTPSTQGGGALSAPTGFLPPWWARSPVVQTLVAQLGIRTWGANEMLKRARGELVRLADGTCLQGFYSPHVAANARGLVILLSGWEGHAGSPYIVRTGRALFRAGFEVFRLNFPDHGDTHDLNEDIFSVAMIDKIFEALGRIVSSIRTRPIFVIGFSMGGNFALSTACRGLPGLRMVIAVSPALDLLEAMRTLESSRIFKGRFLKDWMRSLRKKQELYPYRHRLGEIETAQTLEQVAAELVSRYANQSLEEFYSPYTLTPARLQEMKVPAHIVAALDDPIVGRIDDAALRGVKNLTLHIHERGGHVGFITGLFRPAWYETFIVSVLESELAAVLVPPSLPANLAPPTKNAALAETVNTAAVPRRSS